MELKALGSMVQCVFKATCWVQGLGSLSMFGASGQKR